jgi:hypothetical protein
MLGERRTVLESKILAGWRGSVNKMTVLLYLGYLRQACLVVYGVQCQFKVATMKLCYSI